MTPTGGTDCRPVSSPRSTPSLDLGLKACNYLPSCLNTPNTSSLTFHTRHVIEVSIIMRRSSNPSYASTPPLWEVITSVAERHRDSDEQSVRTLEGQSKDSGDVYNSPKLTRGLSRLACGLIFCSWTRANPRGGPAWESSFQRAGGDSGTLPVHPAGLAPSPHTRVPSALTPAEPHSGTASLWV